MTAYRGTAETTCYFLSPRDPLNIVWIRNATFYVEQVSRSTYTARRKIARQFLAPSSPATYVDLPSTSLLSESSSGHWHLSFLRDSRNHDSLPLTSVWTSTSPIHLVISIPSCYPLVDTTEWITARWNYRYPRRFVAIDNLALIY